MRTAVVGDQVVGTQQLNKDNEISSNLLPGADLGAGGGSNSLLYQQQQQMIGSQYKKSMPRMWIKFDPA